MAPHIIVIVVSLWNFLLILIVFSPLLALNMLVQLPGQACARYSVATQYCNQGAIHVCTALSSHFRNHSIDYLTSQYWRKHSLCNACGGLVLCALIGSFHPQLLAPMKQTIRMASARHPMSCTSVAMIIWIAIHSKPQAYYRSVLTSWRLKMLRLIKK